MFKEDCLLQSSAMLKLYCHVYSTTHSLSAVYNFLWRYIVTCIFCNFGYYLNNTSFLNFKNKMVHFIRTYILNVHFYIIFTLLWSIENSLNQSNIILLQPNAIWLGINPILETEPYFHHQFERQKANLAMETWSQRHLTHQSLSLASRFPPLV